MIAINAQGLLHTTHAALPYLPKAAEDEPRRVADIVNISSIAGRVAWNGYGVYNMTKFGVNGFTEALAPEALAPEDVADDITYMVTRPRHASIGELWIMPTGQV